MQKVLKILAVVGRVFSTIATVVGVLASLATAYIIFAPDTLPKPFYLDYIYPTVVPTAEAVATPTPEPTPIPTVEPGGGLMVDSGTKIINLADPAGRKYIRITIVLEFAPDAEFYTMDHEQQAAYRTEFTTEVTSKMPMVDDAIITWISTKTFDQLYTAEGKELLRLELLHLINERLEEYEVISLYFTEFVVD
jgi:flagellar FliL protein